MTYRMIGRYILSSLIGAVPSSLFRNPKDGTVVTRMPNDFPKQPACSITTSISPMDDGCIPTLWASCWTILPPSAGTRLAMHALYWRAGWRAAPCLGGSKFMTAVARLPTAFHWLRRLSPRHCPSFMTNMTRRIGPMFPWKARLAFRASIPKGIPLLGP